MSVILIGGATASGKSALAMRLAAELDGEIVGADSMQIYGDLRILTARASAADEARVRHHLTGVADGAEDWSVGRWLGEAKAALADIAGRGKTAILAGGTGLYFRALTQGLADIPAVDRGPSEALFDAQGEAQFRLALKGLDPAAEARISPGDRQRLVRAHAVAAQTGTPLSAWQGESGSKPLPPGWRTMVVEPERSELYARCDARLEAMLDQGVLDEVGTLMDRRLDPRAPVMKAVGVRELSAHLRGETSLKTALAAAQAQTRHFAKRQLTWFRNQTPDWPRTEPL